MSRSRSGEQALRVADRTTSTAWRRHVSCADELGDGPHDVGHRRPRCPRAPRSGRSRARRALSNVWIHRPTAPKPVDDRLVARRQQRLHRQLGRHVADDLPGRVGQPDLLGQDLALQRGQRRPGRLLGVRVEDPALLGSGSPAVDREVDGQHARPSRPRRRAAAPPAGPAGARRPRRRAARASGTQPRLSLSGSIRSCGRNRNDAPVVGDRDLLQQLLRPVVRVPCSCARASSLPLTASTTRCGPRTTLIAATPKPPTAVTPSAMSWNASSVVAGRRSQAATAAGSAVRLMVAQE